MTRDLANIASDFNPSTARHHGLPGSSIHSLGSNLTRPPSSAQISDTTAHGSHTDNGPSRDPSHKNTNTRTPCRNTTRVNGPHVSSVGLNGGHSELGSFSDLDRQFDRGGVGIKQETGSRNLGRLIQDCHTVIDILSPDSSSLTRIISPREEKKRLAEAKVSEKFRLPSSSYANTFIWVKVS